MKKISCLMVAMVAVLLMSVSAFAVAPSLTSSSIDIPYTDKSADKYSQNGFGKFKKAIEEKKFDGFVTMINFDYDGKVVTDLNVYEVGSNNLSEFSFEEVGYYERFNVNTDSPVNRYGFFLNSADFIANNNSTLLQGNYILSNFSDPILVNKILSLKGNKNNYNIVNTSVTKLNFNQSFLDGIYIPPTEPQEPTEPPTPPPPIDIDYGFVPYDPSIWVTFMAKIKGYLAVIIPVGYKILAIVIGIPLVIKIVKMFSKS